MKTGIENPYIRIEQILDHLKLTANALAKAIGLPRTQNLYDIRDGKIKKISLDLANKIITVFPVIDKEWLITGNGNMVTVNGINEDKMEYNLQKKDLSKLPIEEKLTYLIDLNIELKNQFEKINSYLETTVEHFDVKINSLFRLVTMTEGQKKELQIPESKEVIDDILKQLS